MKPNIVLIANCRPFSRAAPLAAWLDECQRLLPGGRIDVLVIGKTTDPTAAALRVLAEERNLPVFELNGPADTLIDTDAILNEVSHAVTLWDGVHSGMIQVIATLRARNLLLKRYTYQSKDVSYKEMRAKKRLARQTVSTTHH